MWRNFEIPRELVIFANMPPGTLHVNISHSTKDLHHILKSPTEIYVRGSLSSVVFNFLPASFIVS